MADTPEVPPAPVSPGAGPTGDQTEPHSGRVDAPQPMVTPIEPHPSPIPHLRDFPVQPSHDLAPRDVSDLVLAQLDEDQAADPVLIDLAGKSTIADFMIVATGRSSRHVAAMADHVDEKLREAGARPLSVEGKTQGDWVLIDAGDVIVHLFRPEVREFYSIERMWGADSPAGQSTGITQ